LTLPVHFRIRFRAIRKKISDGFEPNGLFSQPINESEVDNAPRGVVAKGFASIISKDTNMKLITALVMIALGCAGSSATFAGSRAVNAGSSPESAQSSGSKSTVELQNLNQSQSGLLNKQELDLGNAKSGGNATVNVKNVTQGQGWFAEQAENVHRQCRRRQDQRQCR
jgi:hypothetical protein